MQVCAAAPECPPRTRAPRVLQGAGYSRYPRAMPPSGGARHALAACAHQVNAYEHMERRSRRHRMHRRACMRAPAPPRRLVVFQLRKRQRRHLWRHRQWRSISCQWPERRRRRTSATFAAGEAAHVVPLVTIQLSRRRCARARARRQQPPANRCVFAVGQRATHASARRRRRCCCRAGSLLCRRHSHVRRRRRLGSAANTPCIVTRHASSCARRRAATAIACHRQAAQNCCLPTRRRRGGLQ